MKNFKRKKYSRSGKTYFEKSLLKSTFPNDYDSLKTKHISIIKQALQSPLEFQKYFEFLLSRLAEENLVIFAKCLLILDNSLHLVSEDLNREISNFSVNIPEEGDPEEEFKGQTIPLYLELLKLKASILYENTPENLSITLKKGVSFISLTLSLYESLPIVKSKIILQIAQSILSQGSNYHKTTFSLLQGIFQHSKNYDSGELKEFIRIIEEFTDLSSSLIHNIEIAKREYHLELETPEFCNELIEKIPELQESEIWNTELLGEAPLSEISTNIPNKIPEIDVEELKKEKINYIMNRYKHTKTSSLQNIPVFEPRMMQEAPSMNFEHNACMSPYFYRCYPNMMNNIPGEYKANMFEGPSRPVDNQFSKAHIRNYSQHYQFFK